MVSTYDTVRDAVRRAMDEDRAEHRHQRTGDKWPSWLQPVVYLLVVVAGIVLAYAALEKRITLLEQRFTPMEQKIDLLLQGQRAGR